MHYLAKILFNKDICTTSQAAREHAVKVMQGNLIKRIAGDCYDSFCIGGNWTGILTTDLLDQEKLLNFSEKYEETFGSPLERFSLAYFPEASDKQRIVLAEKMFYQYFPDFEGKFPFFRNEFELGYEDDAAIVENEKMYYRWLGKFEGHFYNSGFDGLSFIDLDGTVISPENTIGKKWVVVIDFHH